MSTPAEFLTAYNSLGIQYAADFASASAATGIPASVLAAQLYQESTFGTQPGNGGGPAQFLSSTAQSLGYTQAQLQNPTTAIDAMAKYDAQLQQQTGSLTGALQAYSGNAYPNYANTIEQNATALDTAQGSSSTALQSIPDAPVGAGTANPTVSDQTGAPSFSITDPIPWLKYEGLNLLLIFGGVAGVAIAFASMFHMSPVDVVAASAE